MGVSTSGKGSMGAASFQDKANLLGSGKSADHHCLPMCGANRLVCSIAASLIVKQMPLIAQVKIRNSLLMRAAERKLTLHKSRSALKRFALTWGFSVGKHDALVCRMALARACSCGMRGGKRSHKRIKSVKNQCMLANGNLRKNSTL